MTSAGIGTTVLTFDDLLYGRNPFHIPRYQRSYAWEQEQVDDFIEDINRLVTLRRTESTASHFFGGMVSVQRPQPGTLKGSGFEVIDGQQRLATLMIALQVLHDKFMQLSDDSAKTDPQAASKAKNLADDIRNKLLRYDEIDPSGGKQEQFRLQLSLADDEFFKALLEGHAPVAGRESHKRLVDARDRIDAFIKREVGVPGDYAKKIDALLEIRQALVSGSYVIHIVADSAEQAYTLFTILNDRGRSLSDGDLLRAYTLEELQPHKAMQESTAEAWDVILAGSVTETDQFLGAWYASIKGVRGQRDLPQAYRTEFFKPTAQPASGDDAKRICRVVEQLRDEYRLFDAIKKDGEWPYEEPTASTWDRSRLRRLVSSLRHDLALPLLIAAAARLHEDEFADLVLDLERFAFRFKNIGGGHPSAAARKYYEAAKQIRERKFTLVAFRSELAGLVAKSASDEVFEKQLSAKLDYEYAAQRGNIKYLLTTLEDYRPWLLQGGNGAPTPDKTRVLDFQQIEIEHVYPQHPITVDQELEPTKHRLGNLTFWGPGDNKVAGNLPFANKKAAYQSSSIWMTRRIGQQAEWTAAAVEQCKQEILKDALKVFSFK